MLPLACGPAFFSFPYPAPKHQLTAGPITSANIYNGEAYDATKEVPGWAQTDFSAVGWSPVQPSAEYPSVVPTWQRMEPIRALEVNTASSVTAIAIGSNQTVHVFEFLQNAAGTSILAVSSCPKGTVLKVYFSEVLCGYGTTRWSPRCIKGQPPGNGVTGTVDQRNLGGNWNIQYTCKGAPVETWEPTFTYTGHRFAELHGHTWADPALTAVQQRVIHSDVEASPASSMASAVPRSLSGSIAFSNGPDTQAPAVDGNTCYEGENCAASRPTGAATKTAVLDQISHNVRWDLIDNLHSVPEDCDQRAERWGWMADGEVSSCCTLDALDVFCMYVRVCATVCVTVFMYERKQ